MSFCLHNGIVTATTCCLPQNSIFHLFKNLICFYYLAVETNEEDEELQRALAVSMENMNHLEQVVSEEKDMTTANKDENECSIEKPVYPPLPEEPKGDRNLICRVGFRLPDGKRVQRSFLRTDPIQVKFLLQVVFPLPSFSPYFRNLDSIFFLLWFCSCCGHSAAHSLESPSQSHSA